MSAWCAPLTGAVVRFFIATTNHTTKFLQQILRAVCKSHFGSGCESCLRFVFAAQGLLLFLLSTTPAGDKAGVVVILLIYACVGSARMRSGRDSPLSTCMLFMRVSISFLPSKFKLHNFPTVYAQSSFGLGGAAFGCGLKLPRRTELIFAGSSAKKESRGWAQKIKIFSGQAFGRHALRQPCLCFACRKMSSRFPRIASYCCKIKTWFSCIFKLSYAHDFGRTRNCPHHTNDTAPSCTRVCSGRELNSKHLIITKEQDHGSESFG